MLSQQGTPRYRHNVPTCTCSSMAMSTSPARYRKEENLAIEGHTQVRRRRREKLRYSTQLALAIVNFGGSVR